MISNAQVIMNRCQRPGCGIVMAFTVRRQPPLIINEFAGNTPCERITGHDMSEWTRVTVTRDVVILRALWTVGRAITPGKHSDPTSHILADTLGWKLGESAEIGDLPSWVREAGTVDLTWQGVMLARRLAISARDEWPTTDDPRFKRWDRIVSYLDTWSDRVH